MAKRYQQMKILHRIQLIYPKQIILQVLTKQNTKTYAKGYLLK